MEEFLRKRIRLRRDKEELQLLLRLADQLCQHNLFSSGDILASTLKQLNAILKDPGRIVFSTLASDPLQVDFEDLTDCLDVALLSLDVYGAISNVSVMPRMKPRDTVISSVVRALRPHVVAWGAALHPAHGRFAKTGYDLALVVRKIAMAYHLMHIANADDAKEFLHAHPTFISQAFDLWLHCSQYVPLAPESTDTVTSIVSTVIQIYSQLVHSLSSPSAEDRALFIDILRRALGGKRTLRTVIIYHTKFFAKLPHRPTVMGISINYQIWKYYFTLITNLVGQPEFQQTSVPSKTISTIVSAARRCLEARETTDGAFDAIRLLDILCRKANSNKALARAFGAGLFDLLHDLPACPDDQVSAISSFVDYACAGLYQARVIHAFIRHHPSRFNISRKALPSGNHLATWKNIARVSNDARALYRNSRKEKEWQQAMRCSNDKMVGEVATCRR
ncbi:uncharacterized protein SCHCODRAFT_02715898 [Schizophyllum commune H4-8]|nr:uncharacterized protein SCHCODRAFT_02715898 [Schizophyllum commune H4-8]KAI5886281.1 hypothetical protein SCHCODRAFT_02715898 [Schizophyllum commune H4-8]